MNVFPRKGNHIFRGNMKIEKVESWLAWKWNAVRVTCDDGTYGVGEAQYWGYAEASEAILKRLSDDLAGQDPRHIDEIWNAAYRKYSFRSDAITAALSAIDMALWDIKGKRLGVPVWDLLGGKVRDRVRAMALLGSAEPLHTPDDFAAAARGIKAAGYTATKMTPFPSNWSELPYPELIRTNTEIVAAVREELGWEIDIGIEIHRNMLPSEAVVFAERIAKFLPYFYEDPIAPESVMSMGEVAERLRIPLAVGERNATIWEFREYSALPGVHFVRPDVGLAGGITQAKKIAAIAESFHQRLIPHNFLGPVTTMACVQLAAATPNWDLQEYVIEAGTPRAEAATNTVEVVDGYMQIPDEPGLGTDLDLEGIARHPYDPGGGDPSRRPDGSVALR